jgi:hypothetical protein
VAEAVAPPGIQFVTGDGGKIWFSLAGGNATPDAFTQPKLSGSAKTASGVGAIITAKDGGRQFFLYTPRRTKGKFSLAVIDPEHRTATQTGDYAELGYDEAPDKSWSSKSGRMTFAPKDGGGVVVTFRDVELVPNAAPATGTLKLDLVMDLDQLTGQE